MVENLPMISDVRFEQSPQRLKVVMPTRRNWPLLAIYSILEITWAVMLIGGLVFLFRVAFSGERYAFVFAIMLLVLLLILFRFGRFLSRQWANYAANREILFINREELILRRPISLAGNTDFYDMQHVTPFYLSEKPAALAFDYGYRHVYLGEGLRPEARASLRQFLNSAYFPDHQDESEDE
ncbi:MAG: DUF2244 domain-containing protein [Candidatus Promineofilum sp.]|nr:DUF2244 domain-containing protein [Promineifilum sp.]MCW5863081.1 hypothetical protein [Anaerolineae bacterium]